MQSSLFTPKIKMTITEWIIFSLFVLSGIAMSAYLFVRNPNVGGDGLQYTSVVFNLFSGNGYTSTPWAGILVEPGYGFLTYLINLVIDDIEYSGMLVSALSYILLIPLVFFTVRFLTGKWEALFSMFLVTFSPYLLDYSYINMTECCYTFFLFLSFSIFVRVIFSEKEQKPFIFVVLGLLLSFPILIRPEGWITSFFAFLLFALLSLFRMRDRRRLFHSFAGFLYTVVSFLIVMIPWLLYLHHISGMWVISPKQIGIVSVSSEVSPVNDVELDNQTSESITDKSVYSFNQVVLPNRILSLIVPFITIQLSMNLHAELPLICAIGVWVVLVLTKTIPSKLKLDAILRQKIGLMLLTFLAFYSPAIAFLARKIHPRYMMPYTIYSYILLGIVTVVIIKEIVERLRKPPLMKVGLSLVLIISLLVLFSPYATQMFKMIGLTNRTITNALSTRSSWLGIRGAGLWISRNSENTGNLFLASDNRCGVLLFHANQKKLPIQGECWVDPHKLESMEDVNEFFTAGGDYLVLNLMGAPGSEGLSILWNNPDRAIDYGLEVVKVEPGIFQIYKKGNS